MVFRQILALRGPSVWANFPVIEAWVDLGPWKGRTSDAIPGFQERLLRWLPGLADHQCSLGERGGFVKRLEQGTCLAHALEHVVLELQGLAGVDVSYGRTRETSQEGVFRVVFKYRDETLARECLEAARQLCVSAAESKEFDAAATIAALKQVAEENLLGPSTNSIVQAARRRGIPFRRLNQYSLVQLGYGARQRRIRAAETDGTGAIAEAIAQDKDLTRRLLQAVGVPAPAGYPVKDAAEAWETAEYVGLPVVVKPQDGNQGRGVTTNLTTREHVEAAYEAARQRSESVIVERFIPGRDFRLLVVNGKLVAAARRDPPHVIGDGTRTIRELVDLVNTDPRRSEGHSQVLSRIHLDDIALATLAEQNLTPESVPAAGHEVVIRRNANLSTGGTATDVTDEVHPAVAACAIEAAKTVGLDIAGIDVVAPSVSSPLEQTGGAVLEVNAAPGLRMHLAPSHGTPRDVGEAIAGMLFPTGETGRIPIAAVTGVNGKTTVTRFLAHILRGTGKFVGMTCTDGIYLNDRRISMDDCSGPISAGMVLMNPSVEAAVFETARGGILRAGLGFDQCTVAIVTNIADGDHLGSSEVNTPEDLAQVKRTIVDVVAPDGWGVLNANDPLVAAMATHCPGRIIYFALDEANPVLAAHRAAGGNAIFVRNGAVVFAEGERETELLKLAEVPITMNGRICFEVENTLAAVAGAWVMGIGLDTIRRRAATFVSDMSGVPGRFNVLHISGATVIVDYGHNAAALRALRQAIEVFPHKRRLALYTMAGDRRNSDIIQNGELLGNMVDHAMLYEAHTIRGRAPGEIAALMRDGLAKGSRVKRVDEIPDVHQAMEFALDHVQPGDLLLLQADAIDETIEFVREYLQKPRKQRAERKAASNGVPVGVGAVRANGSNGDVHPLPGRRVSEEVGLCTGIMLQVPAGAKTW